MASEDDEIDNEMEEDAENIENEISEWIDDLKTIVQMLRQRCLDEKQEDYFYPRRFYLDVEDATDYLRVITDALPYLTKQLLMIRRFSNILGASKEVYATLWQLRTHLLKHALSFRVDENGVFMSGNLEFGQFKFKILKHKLVREFDTILEAIEDLPEIQQYIQKPNLDEDKIYIVWREPKHLQGMIRLGGHGLGEIVYVNADTPLGSIIIDYYGIHKLPAVVYPAGGIVQQGVKSLKVVASTITANIKQDAYIDSHLFRNNKQRVEDAQEKLFDLLEKTLQSGAEEINVTEYFKVLRDLRRAMFHIKKILYYELGRFARGNTDLFAPVAVLAYVIEDEINSYHAFGGAYVPDLRSLLVTLLATSATKGILDFLNELRPADITPAIELVVFVGHAACPFCEAVKSALRDYELMGVVEDVQVDYFDALENELPAANFFQYVVREKDNIDQTLPSPMAFYALDAITPTADLPTSFNRLSPDLYSKLKKRFRMAQMKMRARARRERTKDRWEAIIDYHARASGEREPEEEKEETVWKAEGKKITLQQAVVLLRDMGMKWKDIETVVAVFFGRRLQYTVLQRIYKKAKAGLSEEELGEIEEEQYEYEYEFEK